MNPATPLFPDGKAAVDFERLHFIDRQMARDGDRPKETPDK